MLALLVSGRQEKWLLGLILEKPTKGLASQYTGKGPGRGALDAKGTWSAAAPLGDFVSYNLIATLGSVI